MWWYLNELKFSNSLLAHTPRRTSSAATLLGGERPKIRSFPLGRYEKKSRTFPLAQVYFRLSKNKLFYL